MNEKRTFTRWTTDEKRTASLTCEGIKEKVTIMDISAGGMLVSSPHPLKTKDTIYGEFQVLPSIGPYFVRGRITRAVESKGEWYTAVKFEKISTIPAGVQA